MTLATKSIAKAEMTSCSGSCGGANTADMATITLQLGLVTGDTPTVTKALTRLYGDLDVVSQPSEGIQQDSSTYTSNPHHDLITRDVSERLR